MLRIVVAMCLVTCLFCVGISGCTWMGRTTGQAVRGMEDSANDFQKGYDEGHGGAKSDTCPKKSTDTKKKQ